MSPSTSAVKEALVVLGQALIECVSTPEPTAINPDILIDGLIAIAKDRGLWLAPVVPPQAGVAPALTDLARQLEALRIAFRAMPAKGM